jgi:inositol transport system substrate-binding protein
MVLGDRLNIIWRFIMIKESKKRIVGLLMLAACIIVFFTGCSKSTGGGKFNVGYANMADADVFVLARKTAIIEASAGTNVAFQFSDANNDIQKQLDQADIFISKKVDALIIVPVDSAGVIPAVQKANEAKIPVICLGIKASGGDFIFVGSQNYDAGHMQGELFAKLLPQGANVLYLAGTAGLDHSRDRRIGFNDALKEAGRTDVTILADMDGDYVRDKGMKITEDWIQTFADFDGIVAANDQMALGAIEALKGANRIEGVLVSGIDGTSEAIQAVKDGFMVQTVLQNAPGQAKAALEVVQKIAAGESPEKEIFVPFESITKDNVNQY